jgi:hypothetical protein
MNNILLPEAKIKFFLSQFDKMVRSQEGTGVATNLTAQLQSWTDDVEILTFLNWTIGNECLGMKARGACDTWWWVTG